MQHDETGPAKSVMGKVMAAPIHFAPSAVYRQYPEFPSWLHSLRFRICSREAETGTILRLFNSAVGDPHQTLPGPPFVNCSLSHGAA